VIERHGVSRVRRVAAPDGALHDIQDLMTKVWGAAAAQGQDKRCASAAQGGRAQKGHVTGCCTSAVDHRRRLRGIGLAACRAKTGSDASASCACRSRKVQGFGAIRLVPFG
jgi:hypothetical protein